MTARTIALTVDFSASNARIRRTPWAPTAVAPVRAGHYEVKFEDGSRGMAKFKIRAQRWVAAGEDKGKTVAEWRGLTEHGAAVLAARQENGLRLMSQMTREERRALRAARAN